MLVQGKAVNGVRMLGLGLKAVGDIHFRPRENVPFTLTIVDRADASRSITKGATHSFRQDARKASVIPFMPVADCANPANGFLDAARTLCITVQIFPQETKWADPPPQSLTGDATLVLDAQEGPPLSVHSLYLQHASSLFRDMILLRQSSTVAVTSCVDWLESSQDSDSPVAKRQRAELKLSLPGTSRKQTLLLLHCMYAWDGTAAVEDMHLPELVDLANVLDKYGAVLMLRRVDGLLLAACAAEQKLIPGCSDIPEAQAAAWLNVQDAPALFVWAGKLHLSKTQAHLAEYMVQHAPMIDVSKLDATSAAFLRGAQALHTRP